MENKKKQKLSAEDFSLNVSALSTYTDEISFGLGKEVILGANTLKDDLISVKYGIKGASFTIPLVKNTIYAVPGGPGAFVASGATTMAQGTGTMTAISVQDSIYPGTLKDYFYDLYMKNSINNAEDLGQMESVFVESKLEKTSEVVDIMIWQGALSSPAYAATTGNNTLIDGILQKAYAASASTYNITGVAITPANAVTVVDTYLTATTANIPAIINDCRLYLSPAEFQSYLLGVTKEYKYNMNLLETDKIKSILHPGSIGFRVFRTNGLHGTTAKSIITPKENVWVAISDESDLEYKIFYSNYLRAYCFEFNCKLGVAFSQPELVAKIA
jgi:hypothetical protein